MSAIINHIRGFNRFYTSVIGLTNSHLLQSGYSFSEARILYEVNACPGTTARQIMDILKIDEGYLSRLIAKLVRQKILGKRQSREDKRIFCLELTAKGQKEFADVDTRSSAAISDLIGHLTKKEQTELVQLLTKVEALLSDK